MLNTQCLSLLTAVTTPYMIWKGFSVVLDTSSPLACVISESMAPAFHRGDILLINNRTEHIAAGDIPVVWFSSQPLPMVHRAVNVWDESLPDEGRSRFVVPQSSQIFLPAHHILSRLRRVEITKHDVLT